MNNIKNCGNKNYKLVHIEWFFTDWCNYACSYCSAAEEMAQNFSKKDSPSKYKLLLKKLGMIKTPFHIELLGGEPTLHPHIFEVLRELKAMEHCNDIEVVTNLSRSINYFEKMNTPEYDGVRILASYHPEYFTDAFIEKAIAITAMDHLGFMVNVNLSDQKEDWPQILKLINTFDDNDIRYGFNFLHSTPVYSPNYSPEFFEVFSPYLKDNEKQDFVYNFEDGTTSILSESKIVAEGYNQFKGYKCTPLMYTMSSDGTIVNNCTRRKLPIIITTDDLIKEETCPLDYCSCDIMYNFYKEKQ